MLLSSSFRQIEKKVAELFVSSKVVFVDVLFRPLPRCLLKRLHKAQDATAGSWLLRQTERKGKISGVTAGWTGLGMSIAVFPKV